MRKYDTVNSASRAMPRGVLVRIPGLGKET